MVEAFITEYAKKLVDHPNDIAIEIQDQGRYKEIVLYAHQSDIGKLIGKEGRMIGSIKAVISGCKAKESVDYKISVEPAT
jgi:predicted RNA-binding protein YlqC (UPF0109 family)